MLFGKAQKVSQAKETAPPKVEPYEIHVMPVKFHKFLAVKGGRLGRFIIILTIIFIILAGLALGAYYLFNQMKKPPMVANGNQNTNQIMPNENINAAPENNNQDNINQEQPNANANANENTNENINAVNANENTNANENFNQNTNANANENTNLNTPPPAVINYVSSIDADNDGLTDIEEDLYGTDKRKPDTDNDGFIDSEEMVNLYNPKQAGNALLENSGLVNIYTNPDFNYKIFYPTSWLAKPAAQSLAEIVFQSATGEYVQVLVETNVDKLDLVQWYLTQSPSTDMNLLERKTTKNGYDVLISPDKLTSYLMDKNDQSRIYIIAYNIGNKTKINFLSTFKIMVNSFSLQAPELVPEITDTNINDNINQSPEVLQ